MVPAPVAAQVVRDPQRQARLMLTLRSCDIVPFSPDATLSLWAELLGQFRHRRCRGRSCALKRRQMAAQRS